ncbi:MAG: transporter [Gammaproteobacteria bacterium]
MRHTMPSLAGCLLLLLTLPARADLVQLVHGDRISGQLQALDSATCFFKTEFDANLRIPRSRITVLQTNHTVAVNLTSGERVDGIVNIEFKQGKIRVRSERFGSLELATDEMASLSKLKVPEALPAEVDDDLLASLQGTGTEDQPASTNSNNTTEKVGAEQAEQQEEDEQVQQIFLRASGVLLQPGDTQFEISMNYAREEQSDTLLQNTIFTDSRVRTFLLPVIGRLGLLPGLESFLTIPIQYQERELSVGIDTLGAVRNTGSSLFSLGDVQAGLKYAFNRENSLPEIIGTFDFRAPTGRVRNPILPSASVTGSGQWAVAGGMNLIKSFDPLVLFGGLRYEYNIFDVHQGIKFGPWSNLNYNMGVGFAVNSRVTLVGQFQGTYQSARSFSAMDIGGTDVDRVVVRDRELAILRGSFTYKLTNKQFIEPSLTFGLNQISPDYILGLSYTNRL